MTDRTLELWQFTLRSDPAAFTGFLVRYTGVYRQQPIPALSRPTDGFFVFGVAGAVVLDLTVQELGDGVLQLVMKRQTPLRGVSVEHGQQLGEWLTLQLKRNYRLNHSGDRTLPGGATLHEWTFEPTRYVSETLEELIKNLPGELRSPAWWDALNHAFNDDLILNRINLTHERIAEITEIPIATIKRRVRKVIPK